MKVAPPSRLCAILLIGCSLQGFSQSPSESADSLVKWPILQTAVAEYLVAEDLLSREVEPATSGAKQAYKVALEGLLARYDNPKRSEDADRIRKEMKRFERYGLDAEPLKESPAEVRSEWSKLNREIETANQKIALKRSALRSKFAQSLTSIEQQFRSAKDQAGLAMAQRARACASIRTMIEGDRLASTAIGGKSHEQWQEIAREGGYLVGLEVGSGGWFQFNVTGGIRPIFATATGQRRGKKRGNSDGKAIIAKEGYAVGGLMVRSGEVVDSIQIVFMRVNPDGLTLNAQDTYLSEWLGGGGKGGGREISARGRLVVGVTGQTGDVVEGIGLVYLR